MFIGISLPEALLFDIVLIICATSAALTCLNKKLFFFCEEIEEILFYLSDTSMVSKVIDNC